MILNNFFYKMSVLLIFLDTIYIISVVVIVGGADDHVMCNSYSITRVVIGDLILETDHVHTSHISII